MPDAEWDVTRAGATVRINIEAAENLSQTDSDAIFAATEDLLADEKVRVVQFNGPALDEHPPKSLARAIRGLDGLAQRYGKRFMVGPI